MGLPVCGFPVTTAVEVDSANQPSVAYYMGTADASLSKTARNQQAFGPLAIGTAWYLFLLNNTLLKIEAYASLDHGVTWAVVDAAHAPTFTSGNPGIAPVRIGTNVWIAYLGSGGLIVQKFDTTLGTNGQWSTISGAVSISQVFTWDLIVKADGQYVLVSTRNTGLGGTTAYASEVRTYAAGTWSAATNLDAAFTNPVMTGYWFDTTGQLGYVFYTQGLSSAAAWPSPNPLKVVTVNTSGAIGTPQTVAANLTDASEASGQIFTYPAVDAMAIFTNGNAIVSFACRDAASHNFFPAYFQRISGVWSGPTFVSTAAADQFLQGLCINTMLAQVPSSTGPLTYLFWSANNENATTGDGSINQIKFITTTDGVTFSAITLAWDAILHPPLNFTDRVGGGSFLNVNANFVAGTTCYRAMISIGYTDSVSHNYVVAFLSTQDTIRNNYIAMQNSLESSTLRYIV